MVKAERSRRRIRYEQGVGVGDDATGEAVNCEMVERKRAQEVKTRGKEKQAQAAIDGHRGTFLSTHTLKTVAASHW